jgi:hypothetical protein
MKLKDLIGDASLEEIAKIMDFEVSLVDGNGTRAKIDFMDTTDYKAQMIVLRIVPWFDLIKVA